WSVAAVTETGRLAWSGPTRATICAVPALRPRSLPGWSGALVAIATFGLLGIHTASEVTSIDSPEAERSVTASRSTGPAAGGAARRPGSLERARPGAAPVPWLRRSEPAPWRRPHPPRASARHLARFRPRPGSAA